MTIWAPEITRSAGTRYQAIVKALAADIDQGRLRDGDRLPTHRDLAYRLGVTVGTVTRAYAEAERRGLVQGEVGRGTYVRRSGLTPPGFTMIEPGMPGSAPIDLSLNYPARADDEAMLADGLRSLAGRSGIGRLLAYQPHRGMGAHRQMGAEWIARSGLEAAPDQVIVTAGAQHAMMVAFSGLTQPGDAVLTEQLTYPGMKPLANLLRLKLHGVAMDEHGVLPDAFDAACRTHRPKAFYAMPSIQNPTGALMPEERRQAIAKIALDHGVAVVEDDIYGFLLSDAPTPLARFAGPLGYYLTSLSKCLAPGLRTGFLVTPPGRQAMFAAAVRTSLWMASPITNQLAAGWIADGTADRRVLQHRAEASARQEMARQALAGFSYAAHPYGYHGWLTLPEGWQAEGFVSEVRTKGVLVTAAETFAVGRPSVAAIRLCLGAAGNREELARGLDIIATLLREGPAAQLSIV